MGIAIRPAIAADLPLINALIRELADYERMLDEVRFEEDTLGPYLFGPNPMAEVLIGEVDGLACGFALFFHNFSTFEGRPGIYLEDLFVRAPARGHGLGKALLAELARLAASRGCVRLEWAVLDWNAPAIAFYEKLGARALDEWTGMRLSGAELRRLAGLDTNSAQLVVEK
jgi:GNAT superfamily N-acetyltransferase